MSHKLHRNLRLIYGLAFFHSFMVIVPVIVPFFMSKGLSLAQIFYLQAVFATTIVLLEAPSGYIADLFGRRNALLIGSVIHGLGYLWLNFAEGMVQLMLFEITVGVAMSLLSGADLALLYDTQKVLDGNRSKEYSRGIANLGFIKSCAEGLGALLGGALALWSFDLMVAIQSACAWMCLGLAVLVVEPPWKPAEAMGKRPGINHIISHLLLRDQLLRLVVLAIPLYSLATFHVAWLVQPYWEARGLSLSLFGVLWCAQSLTVALASKFGFEVERRCGVVPSLVLIGILPIVGHFGMVLFSGWFGIGIGLALFLCRGLTQVILVNALNRRVPSEFRATANSFTSFLFRLSFISSGPLVGYLAQTRGLDAALLLLGLSSMVLFALVMLPLIRSLKNPRQHLVV